jgi:phosphoribosylaminoimidazole-succinocarboxamide synthase
VIAPIAEGKVREMYPAGDGRLVMVTSDRISAYDAVLPSEVPDKGRILNGLSLYWFAVTADLVDNHVLGWRRSELPERFRDDALVGRAMLVSELEMLPVECVARGYLAGSGWRDYRDRGETSGHRLPEGLRQAAQLPQPIFAPATKAHDGHDENIARDDVADLVGRELADELERVTLAIYARCAERCERVGIILADTKLEFGRDAGGRLVLADEVVTPDSSRFWPRESWAPGQSPPSFDKQFVRDHLDAIGWDHTPPPPPLAESVVAGTRQRYVEAFERITGRTFSDYMEDAAQ